MRAIGLTSKDAYESHPRMRNTKSNIGIAGRKIGAKKRCLLSSENSFIGWEDAERETSAIDAMLRKTGRVMSARYFSAIYPLARSLAKLRYMRPRVFIVHSELLL